MKLDKVQDFNPIKKERTICIQRHIEAYKNEKNIQFCLLRF